MPDNVSFQSSVLATPAANTVVSTEEITTLNGASVSAQHVQRAAVAIRTSDGVAIDLPGDSSNGLDVDVTRVQGTVQVLGSVQGVGTFQALGSVQTVGTSQALGTIQPLAGSVHIANTIPGTVQVLGSVQTVGTSQVLGTVQPLAGSVHLANNGTVVAFPGTTAAGTWMTVRLTDGASFYNASGGGGGGGASAIDEAAFTEAVTSFTPIGGVTTAIGTVDPSAGTTAAAAMSRRRALHVVVRDSADNARGLNVDANGAIAVTVSGTAQVLGSVQTVGTSQVLGSVQGVGTFQVLGSVQTVGTSQVLGTTQPLAGSVHVANTAAVLGSVSAQGYVAAGVLAAGNPVQIGAVGSSGTIAAQGDGSVVRLWADNNGRLQIRGTIDSLPSVTVASMPTTTVTGTVQTHGTSQALGTVQPLAGSVHVANTAAILGSVSAQGYVAHGAAAAGNPMLVGAFGTSGTQVAAADGQAVRLWADLNGRLQVRGTIDSIGTIQALGSIQTVGTSQVLGSVQTVGTSQALGSVQLVGTNQALGTLSVAGHAAPGGVNTNPIQTGGRTTHARPGTQAVGSAVAAWYDLHGRQVVQVGAGTTEPFGTAFVASGNGTVITGRGAGSYMRLFDIVISGSAAGTVRLLEDGTQRWGPLFIAANGGWNMNSAVGVKLPTANTSLVASHSLGTMSITINYAVEGA